VSDIDTGVVDSLKALDPERPIREAEVHPRYRILGSRLIGLAGTPPTVGSCGIACDRVVEVIASVRSWLN
jgi:hypothetical protein